MRKENLYYIWNKDENHPINSYFTTKEFNCQCKYKNCREQRISVELLEKITKIREKCQNPVYITSAFRCENHQKDLRNQGVNTVVASKSQHEIGNAIDFKVKNHTISQLLPIVEQEFEAIGIANTFLHVDMRKDKKRRWNY